MTDNTTPDEYTPTHLSPDMTLPGTAFGLLIGAGLVLSYPEYARSILTLSISIGWLLGFLLTIFPAGQGGN